MKALRFFFLSLLAAFSFAANAQTIEVYKDGRVIDSFSATQVDSVVYAPAAAQPRYYYYAGWDCPTSVEGDEETSLAKLAEKTADEGNGTLFVAGYTTEDLKSFNYNHMLLASENLTHNSKSQWYIVVPNDGVKYIQIYDKTLPNQSIINSSFKEVVTDENGDPLSLENHTIYTFNSFSRTISGIQLY